MKQIFIVILLFYSLNSFSQKAEKSFSMSLGTGVDFISFRDQSSSPLAYSGFGLPIALSTKFNNEKFTHQINFNAISEIISNNYPLRSQANTQLVTWDKVNVNYTFLYRLKKKKNYFGGSLHSMFFYREYDFLDGQSYEFINSLDANYRRTVRISDNYQIGANISLPLLGYIQRKPTLTLQEEFLDDFHNGGNLLKYGKWRSIFMEWFGFNLLLSNNFRISDKMSLTAQIGLEYYSVHFPEKVTNINYPILCYLNYRF